MHESLYFLGGGAVSLRKKSKMIPLSPVSTSAVSMEML